MFDVVDCLADEAALVGRIAELERSKSAAAAEQAVLTAELDAKRRSREAAQGVPAARRGKGLASEIALARRDSPNRGGRHLGFARALVHEMPHTLAALAGGLLSEWRATLIVRESACLSIQDRRTLDARMCADQAGLEGKGDKRIEADAKAIAYELDPHAIVDRAVRAESERTVTCRPAPDNMTYVTALLPMPQGVAVYATLRREADTCGDGRGRGHVMADTLVERITGRPADVPVPVAVELVITDESLLGGDQTPARVPGYGPIPAAIACRLAADAAGDERSTATVRRLYRHPKSGALVAMESRARAFPTGLARYIALRDDTCRTPYCDAPIRHLDHAADHAAGGATSDLNGRGTCEACNYTKQAPGWRTTTRRDEDGTHGCQVVTPTGARHSSKAPPLPGRLGRRPSHLEIAFADILAWRTAA
ncbi:DUF222 domain-containing protein [Mycolicibacterium sp.]|uniref:DUF222 domain-containing protein n=1 Tax=Mycolicibacterium sp. TaxID=2320850 RepID=UPI001A3036FD|nr:DUF222 domain-containing protein [Mycolicibacterium sp.]MBJ7338263.1 DUF222 domain-containing protein [Mycolicibacterium sp.]